MIITLQNTTTRSIAATLLEAQENYSLATGRVLTLLVAANAHDDVESILSTVRAATREHPARVIVLLLDENAAETRIDAEVLVAAAAGASEMVVMRLYGELTNHLDAVVTPLLLPDTPIVAWWPTEAPLTPAQAELGNIAQRRITYLRRSVAGNPLDRLIAHYTPGDSDMMWSKITPWRGVVASAVDRYSHDPVQGIEIHGIASHPSVEIAAGWLASCFDLEVKRYECDTDTLQNSFPIQQLILHCSHGDVSVKIIDAHTAQVSVPDQPESYVALSGRTDAECLAEELRHLDPDAMYARALHGYSRVTLIKGAPN